jgi:hypothetical protein
MDAVIHDGPGRSTARLAVWSNGVKVLDQAK